MSSDQWGPGPWGQAPQPSQHKDAWPEQGDLWGRQQGYQSQQQGPGAAWGEQPQAAAQSAQPQPEYTQPQPEYSQPQQEYAPQQGYSQPQYVLPESQQQEPQYSQPLPQPQLQPQYAQPQQEYPQPQQEYAEQPQAYVQQQEYSQPQYVPQEPQPHLLSQPQPQPQPQPEPQSQPYPQVQYGAPEYGSYETPQPQPQPSLQSQPAQPSHHSGEFGAQQPKPTNNFAVVGAIASMVPLFGLLFSIVGLAKARRRGVGRGVALVGIVLSLLLTAAWGAGGYYVVKSARSSAADPGCASADADYLRYNAQMEQDAAAMTKGGVGSPAFTAAVKTYQADLSTLIGDFTNDAAKAGHPNLQAAIQGVTSDLEQLNADLGDLAGGDYTGASHVMDLNSKLMTDFQHMENLCNSPSNG